jgi:anti-anti-sigma factor
MQSVNLTCHIDRTELNFAGALDVSQARAAHATLNEALLRALPIELHAADVERLDGSGLQLLVAFARGAGERGLALKWRSISPAVRASVDAGGLGAILELPA